MTEAENLTERLGHCYSAIIHDVMRAGGHRNFVLPPEIRLLFPEQRLAGSIFTVSGHVDESAEGHQTLLEWTGLLSKAPSGHVIVCQPHTHDIALMGELSSETLKSRGVLGYVVDGHCRDLPLIRQQHFQVGYRLGTPKDIVGRWLPDGFDVPIVIGDVRIHSGDYLLADEDGIVILPKGAVETIIDAAETAMGTENQIRTAILGGMDPQEAYLKYGKF